MHLSNSFHIEMTQHFPYRDKYFLSLLAGVKINCKVMVSHKSQWGWVVELNKILLNYLLRNPCYKRNAILFLLFLLLVFLFQEYAYLLFTLIDSSRRSFTEVTYARKFHQETCIILPFNKKLISVPSRVYIFISFCQRKLLLLWSLCYKWISGKLISFRGTFWNWWHPTNTVYCTLWVYVEEVKESTLLRHGSCSVPPQSGN